MPPHRALGRSRCRHSTQTRLGRRSRCFAASAIPTPIGRPWPSEPVATSTHGMAGVGWPSSMPRACGIRGCPPRDHAGRASRSRTGGSRRGPSRRRAGRWRRSSGRRSRIGGSRRRARRRGRLRTSRTSDDPTSRRRSSDRVPELLCEPRRLPAVVTRPFYGGAPRGNVEAWRAAGATVRARRPASGSIRSPARCSRRAKLARLIDDDAVVGVTSNRRSSRRRCPLGTGTTSNFARARPDATRARSSSRSPSRTSSRHVTFCARCGSKRRRRRVRLARGRSRPRTRRTRPSSRRSPHGSRRAAQSVRQDSGHGSRLRAIEDSIAAGRSINVTLIFSLERHAAVAEAYVRGLERLVEAGGDPTHVASVASFFVSRVDTEADRRLEEVGREDLQGGLRSTTPSSYQHYLDVFSRPRWDALAAMARDRSAVCGPRPRRRTLRTATSSTSSSSSAATRSTRCRSRPSRRSRITASRARP